ncbi:hypothetical protein E2C01_008698 [Portunus trituberculatus]|uniref:Uncharacterized protein n=1 Tax=Portunus trituberculatus TaxID=210409 RepID=A0A5B7D4J6_PORTR|nr:hypothetical protein [Portunus trituberculatus]
MVVGRGAQGEGDALLKTVLDSKPHLCPFLHCSGGNGVHKYNIETFTGHNSLSSHIPALSVSGRKGPRFQGPHCPASNLFVN